MSALLDSRGPGTGHLSTRNVLGALAALLALMTALSLGSATQAAWAAFVAGVFACGWVMSRGLLTGMTVLRRHRPRVFEDDLVSVKLVVRQSRGHTETLVVIEDQFVASLGPRQRNLIPMMSPRLEAHLHYWKQAERHRGLYVLGPVRLWAADPMGIFFRTAEVGCVTALTVYPRAHSLGGYRLLGRAPPDGPGMDTYARLGQGEEIIGVRPYRPGDPPSRIHWRTSMRRGALHTMELDTHVQGETALFIDLTRTAQYGTGAESTTERALACATSILSEASSLRYRISLTWVRRDVEVFPAGAGIAHLHLLADRLATVEAIGNLKFWEEVQSRACLLNRGSRAIFLATAAATPLEEASRLIRRLLIAGVAADVILFDESGLTRIWREQGPTAAAAPERFKALVAALERAGARVLPLGKERSAADLLPRAAEEPAAVRGR